MMGSYMIWDITFKDITSKIIFESFMKIEKISAKLIHDHYDKDCMKIFESNFYYDMGYLGYAEVEELKGKLIDLGILELNQICLCDIVGNNIISSQSIENGKVQE